MRVEKTVFISYRRTNVFHARAIHLALTARGYDAFLDFEGIDSGDFEQIILRQIDARAHFVIVLTPSALERCTEPGDWLRREIERAIDMQRNIVPLMFESFDFQHVQAALTGKLAALPRYSGVRIPADYFDEAIERLCTRFLNVPLDTVLHPTPPADEPVIADRQARAAAAPAPDLHGLSAEQYFESGRAHQNNGNLTLAIADYTEAIRLDPQFAEAYNNRGFSRQAQGDLDGAVADYDEAIRLNPQYAEAYNNRGSARNAQGNRDGMIADYNEAIRLNPQYAVAYYNRGNVRAKQGNLDGALADYTEAIRLNPQDVLAYNNRGAVRNAQGDLDGAIADYTEAIRLEPTNIYAFYNRADVYQRREDWRAAIADYERYLALGGGVRYGDQAEVERKIRELRAKLG